MGARTPGRAEAGSVLSEAGPWASRVSRGDQAAGSRSWWAGRRGPRVRLRDGPVRAASVDPEPPPPRDRSQQRALSLSRPPWVSAASRALSRTRNPGYTSCPTMQLSTQRTSPRPPRLQLPRPFRCLTGAPRATGAWAYAFTTPWQPPQQRTNAPDGLGLPAAPGSLCCAQHEAQAQRRPVDGRTHADRQEAAADFCVFLDSICLSGIH